MAANIRRLWCTEPFRLFFPLAFLLGAFGVFHWLLFAIGATERYLGLFHAVTQMQAFLPAFAAGFLFTAIPKRTQSAPASWAEIASVAALLITVSAATLEGTAWLGQVAYAMALIVIAQFAMRRFLGRESGRRPPASFAFVPVGIFGGVIGALLFARALVPGGSAWMFAIGRALVLEGVFFCLVLGIGAFFLPLALRGEAAPDFDRRKHAAAIVAYAVAGLVSLATFVVDQLASARLGPLLRALVATVVFVMSGAWRSPTRPGANRRLIWLAPWALPVGLAAAALLPAHRTAAMHIVYVGGFGVLAFAVATHVALGHGGRPAEQNGRPVAVVAFGLLLTIAMGLRSIATVFVTHYPLWIGMASTIWLLGAVVWIAYLLPRLWRTPDTAEDPPTSP